MAFNRPARKTLIERAQADLTGRVTGGDATLPVAVLKALAYVNGGSVDGLYGYLDYMKDQLLVDKCDEDWLLRHATLHKVPRKDAGPAKGPFNVTATAAVSLSPGTVWQRTSDGTQFMTMAAVDLAVGTASIDVVAVVAGTAGNTAAGTELRLVQTIEGVVNVGTVGAAGITDGTAQEDVETWRARVIAVIQDPGSGGKPSDYVAWALECDGVTRAWVYPHEMGAGSITVRFARDNDAAGPIPDAAAVEVVRAYIEGRMPANVPEFYVVPPVAAPIDFVIQGLSPGTETEKAAVKAELADLLRREAIPAGTIIRSHLTAAISGAAGEEDHVLVSPAGNVVNGVGRMATMGEITWLP